MRLRDEIRAVKSQLENDSKWKTDFQNGLTEIRQLVKELGEKLNTEIDTRKTDVLTLKEQQITLEKASIPMSVDQKKYQVFKGTLIGIGASVIAGLILFAIQHFTK